ncbi:hypothetical protein C1A50_1927 [Paenibacillus polymyxa]|nr:hypothetical protein C1A50_1927 [Paenibacillus polymyxa]
MSKEVVQRFVNIHSFSTLLLLVYAGKRAKKQPAKNGLFGF